MRAPGPSRSNGTADERVTWIGAFGDRREHESGRRRSGQILGGVDRDIGAAVEHGLLHFFGEHAQATDRVQIGGLVAISGRADQYELDVAADERADALGLPPRERTRAGRDSDHSVSTVGSVGRSKREARASA